MKDINILKGEKTKKIIALIIFAVFYVLSFFTSNSPYSEYPKYPFFSFVISAFTVAAFLCITAIFSKSKKFLITMSVYFAILLFIVIYATITGGIPHSPFVIYVIAIVIVLQFGIPLDQFFMGIEKILNVIGIEISNDYSGLVWLAIIISLFYMTYFISRRMRKDEIK